MDTFYPFMYKPKVKKEEFEQLPLYIELIPPELEIITPPSEEEKEDHIIVIDLF